MPGGVYLSYSLRPYAGPDDDEQFAILSAAADPNPWTIADLTEWRRTFPEGGSEYDLVAVDQHNVIIGHGHLHRFPWLTAGEFYVHALMHPDHRDQGAGSLLFTGLANFAREHGATSLVTVVHADDHRSVRFAEQRGFTIRRHEYVSKLDLANVDEAPFAGVLTGLERQGLRFFTYADEPREAELYELARRNYLDMPGVEPTAQYLSLDAWRKRWLEDPDAPQDCMIIAADGDKLVGVTRMGWQNKEGEMKNYHSSVLREYRGRKIALALKFLAIRTARRHGVTALLTNNDSRNTAILRVNEQFGYVPSAGVYHMTRL